MEILNYAIYVCITWIVLPMERCNFVSVKLLHTNKGNTEKENVFDAGNT